MHWASTNNPTEPPVTGKVAIALAFITGTWMLVEGLHRLIAGDYVRMHGQLGPWANLLRHTGIDPMRAAPLFIAWGIAWLVIANLYLFRNTEVSWRGMIVAVVLSFWYAGFATVLEIVQLVLLLLPRTRRVLRA